MEIEASYNFRRVSDKLTTSGLVRPAILKALAAQGYNVVINLLPDSHEHAVRGEREIVESQGIKYIYIPVDFKYPTRSDFSRFSMALDRVLEEKVHVHCSANYRVTAFYAMYEFHCGRWSIEQAIKFISEIWRPAEHPGWSEFIADMLVPARQAVAADSGDVIPSERQRLASA